MTGLRRFWRATRYRQLLRSLAGPQLLRAFADVHPHAFFVEIGSNDGEQHDHLRPLILSRPWRGIMVEPVPYVYERLRRNYESQGRIVLENLAVTDRDGTLPFFHLRQPRPDELERLPDWYDGIGSFSREAVASHADQIPDIEDRIVERQVPALTFGALCRRNRVDQVDLLLIDTEGHDWEILRSIDFVVWHPRLVIYEHYHLSAPDRAAARAHMERQGYQTMEEGFDTFCVNAHIEDEVTRAWCSLTPAVLGVAAYEEVAA
ncbi:MAG: FkbM family methyltransferase [Thermoleophilaceae bacterium]